MTIVETDELINFAQTLGFTKELASDILDSDEILPSREIVTKDFYLEDIEHSKISADSKKILKSYFKVHYLKTFTLI